MRIEEKLKDFTETNKMAGNKGALCVGLIVTRHAKKLGFPLDSSQLLTEGGGQVLGLGKAAVQSILKEHGIDNVLAEEGGRTSRGSVGNMRKYVEFLNELNNDASLDIAEVETWWIERVKEFFAGKPFVFKFDNSKSLRSVIGDLISQAVKRQEKSKGATIFGTILQHLIGAKLNLLLNSDVEHHGASVADAVSDRPSDFIIEDVAIHITTAPSESLIRKCKRNLESGMRPVIITIDRGLPIASGLAEQAGIAERVDVFEAEQFLASNLYEIGKFASSGRRVTAENLITEYNSIVAKCETDPSLRIEIQK